MHWKEARLFAGRAFSFEVFVMTNHRCWLVSATLVNAMFTALMLMAHPVLGQEADDEDQPPGLRARYQAGTSIVERVDADIAFVWGDAAPDERLPPGKFQAAWSGTLLLRGEERYRFHAFIQGRVKLVVNGRAVLEGSTEQPQWISGPETPLTFGDQPFELAFERTGDAARLKLYWSSDDFPLEPVPYHVLFQKQPANDLTLIERGRIQFASFRCGNCHAGSERGTTARDAGLPAPALDHVGVGTRRDWLIKKLTQSGDVDKHPRAAGDRMPHFGFSADDAAAIVAALLATATPIELSPTLKLKAAEHDKDVQAGATLIRSVGCLACHTWNSLGEPTPFGGGSLDDIAQKRSAAWLTTWLSDPAKIRRENVMVLRLKPK